jgi:hypothetical protein
MVSPKTQGEMPGALICRPFPSVSSINKTTAAEAVAGAEDVTLTLSHFHNLQLSHYDATSWPISVPWLFRVHSQLQIGHLVDSSHPPKPMQLDRRRKLQILQQSRQHAASNKPTVNLFQLLIHSTFPTLPLHHHRLKPRQTSRQQNKPAASATHQWSIVRHGSFAATRRN